MFSNCGGRREKFWGISCEKSRFYAKKSYFFPILGGAPPPPPWIRPCIRSRLRRPPDSDYPFGIFKLFLYTSYIFRPFPLSVYIVNDYMSSDFVHHPGTYNNGRIILLMVLCIKIFIRNISYRLPFW
jgi:hypothetical protein